MEEENVGFSLSTEKEIIENAEPTVPKTNCGAFEIIIDPEPEAPLASSSPAVSANVLREKTTTENLNAMNVMKPEKPEKESSWTKLPGQEENIGRPTIHQMFDELEEFPDHRSFLNSLVQEVSQACTLGVQKSLQELPPTKFHVPELGLPKNELREWSRIDNDALGYQVTEIGGPVWESVAARSTVDLLDGMVLENR